MKLGSFARLLLVMAVLAVGGTAWAQTPTPAPAAPAAPPPIGVNPVAPVSPFKTGGSLRWRTEFMDNLRPQDFGSKGKAETHLLHNLRTFIYGEYTEASWMARIEAIDARELAHGDTVSTDEDYADLHQAWFQWGADQSPLAVRLGRTSLSIGDKRLVNSPKWLNLVRSWDSALIMVRQDWGAVQIFRGNVVVAQRRRGDENDEDQDLSFVLYTSPKRAVTWQAGYFLLDKAGVVSSQDVSRHTVYGNAKGARSGIDWEATGAWQFGDDKGKDIEAYGVLTKFAHSFAGDLKPNVRLEYNLASGDGDPNDDKSGTFDPMYGEVHGPYGIMDLIKWSNMRELALVAGIKPTKALGLSLELHKFWLESVQASWISPSSTVAAGAHGRDSELGQEISLVATYSPEAKLGSSGWKLELGHAVFLPGKFADQAFTNPDNAAFTYAQLMLEW